MNEDRVRVFGTGSTATLLATIVRCNLAADPARAAMLDGAAGVVSVRTTDTSETVGLEFRDRELRIYADGNAPADVEVHGDTETLLRVLASPTLLGVPHPFRRAGLVAIGRVLGGRVRTRGLVRGRRLAGRVRGLLTTDP